MYVCMYVRTYVCMYVHMYVCMYVRTYIHTYLRMHVCMYACKYVCMYCKPDHFPQGGHLQGQHEEASYNETVQDKTHTFLHQASHLFLS